MTKLYTKIVSCGKNEQKKGISKIKFRGEDHHCSWWRHGHCLDQLHVVPLCSMPRRRLSDWLWASYCTSSKRKFFASYTPKWLGYLGVEIMGSKALQRLQALVEFIWQPISIRSWCLKMSHVYQIFSSIFYQPAI